MQYSLIDDGRAKVLTVLVNGVPHVATSNTHPNFNDLVARVLDGDTGVVDAFTVEKAVAERFEKLSERVSVAGGQVYFDGDPVNDAIGEQILRFINEGVEDWKPLVAFLDKVMQNPNDHSREQLYRWLARHAFTLTPEGDIVGYKGVRDDFTSVNAGPAIVDDVPMTGHIPNNPGSEITMPRSKVQFDPSIGCASGLHVANWRYASNWSTKTLEVHVNPRDVVSVPTDSNDEKVRVCRYVVVREVNEPYNGPVLEASASEDELDDAWENMDDLDEDYSEYCDDCGDDHDPLDYCPADDYDEDDEPENSYGVSGVLGGFVYGGTGSGKSDGVFNLNVQAYGSGKVDTRLNHLGQQRDANGRFLPRS